MSKIPPIIFNKQGPFYDKFRKWFWHTCRFRRYGLLIHDQLPQNFPDVEEAVRRLPPDVFDAMCFRQMRAQTLSMHNEILPKEEWTKYEDETWYLLPYLQEVWYETSLLKGWTNAKPQYTMKHIYTKYGARHPDHH